MLQRVQTIRRWLPLASGATLGLLVTLLTTVHAGALLPSLLLTSVTGGLSVSGVVPLSAQASALGFSSVQFEVSGQPVGPLITAGACTVTWDTRAFSNGPHTVTAVARDSQGTPAWALPTLVIVANSNQLDGTPPAVSITSPAAGAALSGTVTVFANAFDDVALAGVWFTLDGATVSPEMPAAQGVVSWSFVTTATSQGTHVLAAVARDAAGNVTTSAPVTVTVTTTVDTAPPTVSIASPDGGAVLSGTASITATAADNTGVAGVRFTVDGTPIGSEDLAAPYQVSWNTAGVGNGTHALRAIARDLAGNTTTSSAVVVTTTNATTDTTPPVVAVTAPGAGATVSGSVTVAATASDGVGVVSVQFSVDGVNLGAADTAAPFQVTWTTIGATQGAHTLRAVARDAAGNTSTSTAVTVTVNNASSDRTSPSVSITAPTSGASLKGTVIITAAASDNVGVAGVQFTVNGAPVGTEDTAAPFQSTWNTTTVANGARVLRAVARDAAGNTRTSTPVTVVVSNNSSDTVLPTVSLIAPAANATVAGTVTLTGSAVDNVGVAGVQFRVDGVNIGAEDRSAPYSVSWATSGVLNGLHTISVVARDTAGNTATSVADITVRNLGSGVPGDLNDDGFPDLLFAHSSGRLHAWFMRGDRLVDNRALTPAATDPAWHVVSIDDFNGDRKSDLLWQHTQTGRLYLWYMDGTTLIDSEFLSDVDTPWRVSATGDLNGDGSTDLIWQHPETGQLQAWLLNRTLTISAGALTPGLMDSSWRIAGAADLNGDGRADLVWQNSASGALAHWLMNGLVATAFGTPTPAATNQAWILQAVADFDRNGSPDFVWQHSSTNQLYFWGMNGTTLRESTFLTPSQVAPGWQIVGGK